MLRLRPRAKRAENAKRTSDYGFSSSIVCSRPIMLMDLGYPRCRGIPRKLRLPNFLMTPAHNGISPSIQHYVSQSSCRSSSQATADVAARFLTLCHQMHGARRLAWARHREAERAEACHSLPRNGRGRRFAVGNPRRANCRDQANQQFKAERKSETDLTHVGLLARRPLD